MNSPIDLLDIGYQSVKVIQVLAKIYQNQVFGNSIISSLKDISGTLKSIENLLQIQIAQPLKSGLAMLTDAEAEYEFDNESGKELANKALDHFNRAEGQVVEIENQLLTLIGKACTYKLLSKIGAYNNTAILANELFRKLKKHQEETEIEENGQIRNSIKDLILEILDDMDINTSQIDDQTDILSLGLDSMSLLEILATIEQKYEINIPMSDLPNLRKLEDCLAIVKKYKKNTI